MVFGFDLSVKEFAVYFLVMYFSLDLLFLIMNTLSRTKPGGCQDPNNTWITGPFLITNIVSPDDCSSGGGGPENLGKWRRYAGVGKTCLYANDIDKVVEDTLNDHIVEGYTPVQLLAYVLVPTITFLSIGWYLISTRGSKAEITFWLLIATLVYTGLTTIVDRSDVQILPDGGDKSCLNKISDNLGLSQGDEIMFNYVARRAGDATECLIEGTYLSTGEGGIAPDGQQIQVRGDIANCDADNINVF
jgi:hypothetical protein